MEKQNITNCNCATDYPKWPGLHVEYLILEAEDFIVCIDHELDVDWQTNEKYDQTGPKDSALHNKIMNIAASLECIPNDHQRRTVRLNFKRMIGEGVARTLKHDYSCAEAMLTTARTYIASRNVEMARFWQLSTGCILALTIGALGVSMWPCRVTLISMIGGTSYYLLLSGVAGGLGAVLSMIFRMGNSYPTNEAPIKLHVLEALSRVLAGSLSGILVAASINVGLILPVIAASAHAHVAMFIAALAAGASERWAPSLIAQVEGSSNKKQKGNGAAE